MKIAPLSLSPFLLFTRPLSLCDDIRPDKSAVKNVSGMAVNVCRDVENFWPPTFKWIISPQPLLKILLLGDP